MSRPVSESFTPQSPSNPFTSETVAREEFARSDHGSFSAVYNIAPIVPGHCLLIPRRPVLSIFELSTEEYQEFWTFAKEVTQFLQQVYRTESFDWTIQELEPAGQTVPHLHLHVIPRVTGDLTTPGEWYDRLEQDRQVQAIDSSKRKRISTDEMQKTVSWLSQKWVEFHNNSEGSTACSP